MRKIAFYMPLAGGLTGGPRRLLTLAARLQTRGVAVVIMSEPGSDLLRVAKDLRLEICPVPTVGSLSRRGGALLSTRIMDRLRTVLNLLRQNLLVARALRQTCADVVWTRSAKGMAFCGVASVASRRHLIWDLVGDVHRGSSVSVLYRFGLLAARAIVFQYAGAPAEIFGDRVAHKHGHKFFPIIPGIDFDRLQRGQAAQPAANQTVGEAPTQATFVMLQVGTVCANKNQAFTLQVLAQARARGLGTGWELWFAFDEMQDPDVPRLVDELGLSGCVRFLGWRDDVPELMRRADLLLLPSVSEGVPNVVQEAMYLGLPAIANRAGGLAEVVADGRNGWIISIDAPDAWAEKIVWCRRHPEQLQAAGAAAALHADAHFNAEVWAAAYARVFSH